MIFERAICKGRRKEKVIRGRRGRLDRERRVKNKRTKVRCDDDEALSYEKGEIEETAHSICIRQLKDDANRLKCRKNQQKK